MPRCLLVSGFGLVLVWSAIACLSRQFVYGEGHAERPIVAFVCLYLAAWGIFAFAWRTVGQASQRHRLLPTILLIGLVLRAVMFATNPIQESDFYRYIWDGQMVAHQQHPFSHAPAEQTPGLYAAGDTRQAAQLVHERINHPQVKTIYPTVAQVVFGVNAYLWGWHPYGFRLTFLVADLALLAVLLALLRQRGLPSAWILAYAWCPLVLKEFTNSMHLDVVCALFLGGMLLLLERRPWWAAACLAGAVLVKITPVVLLPLIVGWLWRTQSRRKAAEFTALFALLVACGLAWMLVGVRGATEGLQQFSRDWIMNDSIYELVLIVLKSKAATKTVLFGSYAVIVTALAWRMDHFDRLVRTSLFALMALFLISPVGNPWYLGWLLPFWVLVRDRLTLLLMAMTSLYYFNFLVSYWDLSSRHYALLQTVEYVPVYLYLLWGWGQRARNKAPSDENDSMIADRSS